MTPRFWVLILFQLVTIVNALKVIEVQIINIRIVSFNFFLAFFGRVSSLLVLQSFARLQVHEL